MKTIKVLTPQVIKRHVASQNIKAISGFLSLNTPQQYRRTPFRLISEDKMSWVYCTAFDFTSPLADFHDKEVVFYAPRSRGISVVDAHNGNGKFVWVTGSSAIFLKEMFDAHMATKKQNVEYV
jgi:hypothetical protein